MNSWPLIASGLLMGVTGSIHCAAMCSALQRTAIDGRRIIAIRSLDRHPRHDLWFQGGRILGYTLLGLAAGLAGEWLLTVASLQPAFQSIWAALNAVLLSIGLSLLLSGREPSWLAGLASNWSGRRLALPTAADGAARGRGETKRLGLALAGRGALWALLPCGLLYAALSLAILAGEPAGAALVMAAFGIGTASGLLVFQGGLRRLLSLIVGTGRPQAQADAVGMRVSGLLLTTMAAFALIAAILGRGNPFCG